MDPVNPYAPPTAPLGQSFAQALTPDELRRARYGRRAWVCLFGLNLVVPSIFALNALEPEGWFGLVAAVALVGGTGYALLVCYPRRIGVAIAGAAVVAPTQLFPLLQIAAGMLGLVVGGLGLEAGDSEVSGEDDPSLAHFGAVRAFVATGVTGLALIATSLIIGHLLRKARLVWRRGGGRIVGDFGPERLHEPTPDA